MKIRTYIAGNLAFFLIPLLCMGDAKSEWEDHFKRYTLNQWDAIQVAQGQTKKGLISKKQIQEFQNELSQVRSLAPKFDDVHDYNIATLFDSVVLYIGAKDLKLFESLGTNPKKGSYRVVYDFPLQGTKIKGLDTLNRELAADKATLQVEKYDDDPLISLRIHFRNPLDIPTVAKRYAKLNFVSDAYSGGALVGDGNRVFRLQNKDEVDYVLRRGEGDCPAGCTIITMGYFQIKDHKVVEIKRDNPYIAPFGVPARFPLKAFKDFADIAEKSRSPDWWVRLHVAKTMGYILPDQGKRTPWVGEDFDSLDRSSYLFKTLSQDLLDHRDQAVAILKRLSKDKNSRVKEVAHQSLYYLKYPEYKGEEND